MSWHRDPGIIRLAVAIALVLTFVGCESYGVRRGATVYDPEVRVKQCAASCRAFDSERNRCVEYHQNTAEHCLDQMEN